MEPEGIVSRTLDFAPERITELAAELTSGDLLYCSPLLGTLPANAFPRPWRGGAPFDQLVASLAERGLRLVHHAPFYLRTESTA
jgi:hypothetical protein